MFYSKYIFFPALFQVRPKTMAEVCGLKLDDVLIKINGVESCELTYEEAVQEIEKGHDSFEMVIERYVCQNATPEKRPVKKRQTSARL